MAEPFHQLAAILFVDIVDYSAMMQEDEQSAIHKVTQFREAVELIASELNGTVIQYYGDGCLLLFQSSTDSAEFAKLLQTALQEEHDIPARIGIHMGDVLMHGGNVFGDVVNIAARIQALAPTGGIYVSEMVYRNIVNKQGLDCVFIKDEKLKNIKEPVRIYELLTPRSQPVFTPPDPQVKKKTSVAVLPFFNMSNDEDQEYFSDGLTEDIITQLSKIKALKVVSRTSVMQYKKNLKHIKDIGRELGVAVILEGSVQRAQDQVRITAQLIDAETDEHLWAESYDRSVKDIFSIQREVALSIADVLNAKLSQQETKQLDQTPTTDMVAYDQYLKGKFLVEKRTKLEVIAARELFEQAVARDSNFSNAYSGLAVTYLLASFRGYEDPVKMLWMAKKYIDLGLALNPLSGESQAALGYWYHQKFDWHAAEITYRRALELSPNQSNVYLWLGILLEGKGETEEALRLFEKGCTINPGFDYLTVNEVHCLVNANKIDEAIVKQKGLVEKSAEDPELQKVYLNDLARLWWWADNVDEAIATAEMAGDESLVKFFREGDNADMVKSVDEKYEQMQRDSEYISQFWMGNDYARAGAREKALECFNNAIALKEVPITVLLTTHYDYVNIRYLNMALIRRKVKMLVNF